MIPNTQLAEVRLGKTEVPHLAEMVEDGNPSLVFFLGFLLVPTRNLYTRIIRI